jgi:predicted transcriptional regulator
MPSDKPIVSFRIRPDIKEGLQRLAKADRRTLSAYIEIVLDQHLEAAKKQKGRK